jgi:hypothetical protein
MLEEKSEYLGHAGILAARPYPVTPFLFEAVQLAGASNFVFDGIAHKA